MIPSIMFLLFPFLSFPFLSYSFFPSSLSIVEKDGRWEECLSYPVPSPFLSLTRFPLRSCWTALQLLETQFPASCHEAFVNS